MLASPETEQSATTGGYDLSYPSVTQQPSDHSIWVQPNAEGHWSWTLIDGEGRIDLEGAAPGRDAALATARFASTTIGALQRIGARRT